MISNDIVADAPALPSPESSLFSSALLEKENRMIDLSCPICFRVLRSAQRIELECGHRICGKCARQWVLFHGRCPICRRSSLYYYRHLRSSVHKSDILNKFCEEMNTMGRICSLVVMSIEDYIGHYSLLLQRCVLNHKRVWFHEPIFLNLRSVVDEFVKGSIFLFEHSFLIEEQNQNSRNELDKKRKQKRLHIYQILRAMRAFLR